jgi:hypothetical protein
MATNNETEVALPVETNGQANIGKVMGLEALDEIVEVVEAWSRDANEYLVHGYRLLGVYPFAELKTKNTTDYVKKSVFYVLGRTRFVAHHDIIRELKGNQR